MKTTGTDPSNAPLLGEMLGAAALTMKGFVVATSLLSKVGFEAIAFITTFVEVIDIGPL